MTDKIHNFILIYYVLEPNNLLEPVGYVSALRHIQEMSCMYMNLQIISLLILLNPLQSLKQLLFSLSLSLSEVAEYITNVVSICVTSLLSAAGRV